MPTTDIAAILKHDARVTSYKLALLRAINDVVLTYPDLDARGMPVAVPLRVLARFWIAYYWPFVNPHRPIFQGPRSVHEGVLSNDISFRPELTELRRAWEAVLCGPSTPADGFFLAAELVVPRRRAAYPQALHVAERNAIAAIVDALLQPIQYAGPTQWELFPRPIRCDRLPFIAARLPGTASADRCVVVQADLWRTFRDLSLWIEALAIHEWCLFTERVHRDPDHPIDRGEVYRLLTERPVVRRGLAWERANVDELLAAGVTFSCPWTGREIRRDATYDLDHLVPVSAYPIHELWNLLPSDRSFNQHVKRDRVPSVARLEAALPHLADTYARYLESPLLAQALREDAALRFPDLTPVDPTYPHSLACAVTRFLAQLADARNLARFL